MTNLLKGRSSRFKDIGSTEGLEWFASMHRCMKEHDDLQADDEPSSEAEPSIKLEWPSFDVMNSTIDGKTSHPEYKYPVAVLVENAGAWYLSF